MTDLTALLKRKKIKPKYKSALRLTRLSKIGLSALVAIEGAKYVAKKMGFDPENLPSDKYTEWMKKQSASVKKARKKSLGGEIVIGKNVDKDLL